jgi:PAS domain S-box-containing protein
VFGTLIMMIVAYLAGRSFVADGAISVLLLGCGALSFGISCLLAPIPIHMERINLGLTIYNVGVLLSGMLHLVGAVAGGSFAIRGYTWRGYLLLNSAYAGVVLVFGLIWLGVNSQVIPVFFLQGQGPTVIRQIVLASAIVSFSLAGLVYLASSRGQTSVFIQFYAYGLILIATGLFGVLLITHVGGILGWVGRLTQYGGGLYILVAVIAAYQQSGRLQLSLRSALLHSERRFRLAASAAGIGEYYQDFETGEEYWSPEILQIIGLNPGERPQLEDGIPAAVHPEDRPQVLAEVMGCFEARRSEFSSEHRIVRRDGDVRWVLVRGRLQYNGRDTALSVYGIAMDITESKRTEEALRSSQARERAYLEHLPVGLWFANEKGELIYGNPAGQQIWSGARYVGVDEFHEYKAWWHDTGEPIQPEDWAVARAIRRGETSLNEEIDIQCFDGTRKTILNSAVPVLDASGAIAGAVVINQDITERKHAERVLRQSQEELERRVAKRTSQLHQRADQLARMASELTLTEQRERRRLAQVLHDHLQQLLVGAKFGLRVLSNHADEQLQRYVVQVEELINESIKASRSLTVELSPPILHEAGLAAGFEWLARWMEEKYGLKVHLESDHRVESDREDVRVLVFQSVRELLFNIVKHAQVTEAEVELALHDPDHLRVTVIDRGRGFKAEKAWKVDAEPGGGFGLFSIRERLTLLGGRIEIDSREGEGTRCTLVAPMRYESASSELSTDTKPQGAMQPARSDIHPEAAEALDGEDIRLLLVDDHAVMRQGLSALLSEQPSITVVAEADNGAAAIEQARHIHPDIILMDFSMPQMDGVEATRRIHEEMPEIRIIGLSMYEERDRSAAMIEAGATAYLPKTGSTDKLIETIRQVCRPASADHDDPVHTQHNETSQ